jgi:hypothetical protein
MLWRNTRRALRLTLLSILLVFVVPPSVFAQETFDITLVVEEATLNRTTGTVTITLGVECVVNNFDVFGSIDVDVTQRVGKVVVIGGNGVFTGGLCSSNPEQPGTTITFEVVASEGQFKPGRAIVHATVSARYFDEFQGVDVFGSDDLSTTMVLRPSH